MIIIPQFPGQKNGKIGGRLAEEGRGSDVDRYSFVTPGSRAGPQRSLSL
jgi:hypothetical protein